MTPPTARDHQYDGVPLAMFAAVLMLASFATAAVALWLFAVTTWVLPARDPGHITMWRWVALGFSAFCALSWGCIATGARRALLRWSVLALSLAAIGLGGWGIARMLRETNGGAHFEGYLLLMGLVLVGHGLAGAVYAVRAAVERA
ncbi:MAG TPA: hypothetical protein VJY35_03135 [Candidatus Eisenbacteria bacterium]|nr:hypothetical protein [Candidatus Eisenbacteria bacterium]